MSDWEDDYDAMWSDTSTTNAGPTTISLDDLNAVDISNFDPMYDDFYDTSSYDDFYDTSSLDEILGIGKKDDKNIFQKVLGGIGSTVGGIGSALLGGGGGGGGGGNSTSNLLRALGIGGAAYLAKDKGYFDPKRPKVGYQGKIPKYQAIQEQVTGRDDSDRRPGSGGRRYMSDVIYAQQPENQKPMSVAEARTAAKAQAQGFAEGGDVAAFLQGLGGGEGGGGQSFQQLMQGMQPQGRAAPQQIQPAPTQPAPMPAPSGGNFDIEAVLAMLQKQQGGKTQPTEDLALPSKYKMPEPDYQVGSDGGVYDAAFYGYDMGGMTVNSYDPETDTYTGTTTNGMTGRPSPKTWKSSELPQGYKDAYSSYQKGELKYKDQRAPGQQIEDILGKLGDFKSAPVTEGGDISEKLKEAMKGKVPPRDPTAPAPRLPPGKGDFDPKKGQRKSKPIPSPMQPPPMGMPKLPPRQPQPVPVPIPRNMPKRPQPMPDLPPRQTRPTPPVDYSKILEGMGGIGGMFAEGGEVGYLNGNSDGQADEVKANIDGVQEARLSDGEYVLPADLVALLGNGNSNAGAKALDDFMAMVRKQGTGTEKQQKNIDVTKVLETLTKKPKRAPRANKALARKIGKG